MDIRKYSTINSIIDKSGDVNAAILRQPDFIKTPIYKEIIKKTKCLNIFNGITFAQRVYFLIQNLEIKKCPICNSPYIFFPKSQKTFSFCRHKKNINIDHSKMALDRYEKTNNQFIKSIYDKTIHTAEKEFNDTLNLLIKKKENYAFLISKKYFWFYHDCIVKTEDLIPFNYNNFKIPERIYCLANNLTEIPRCKYCGIPIQFTNRIKGYPSSCPNCAQLKNNDTRFQTTKEKLNSLIDQSRYEIISYPSLLNFEPLIIKCKKCGIISEWFLNNGGLNNPELFNRLCKNCESVISKGEEELFQFIKEIYDGEVIHKKNSRKIIPPKELDIYIPNKKIAFEYNGIYWHQTQSETLFDQRHVDKTNECEKKGIQLIHIFEDLWNTNKELVKSKIKNLFGIYEHVVFARKCQIKEIKNSLESKKFLNENHLQGNSYAKVNIGLYYNQTLIAIMTFGKPRFDKKHEWEMVRYCSKQGYHIPGAAGKLLKYFERNYNPKNLISYADRSWSVGKMYISLGFNLSHISNPNYWYIKGTLKLSRIKCQKHKLSKFLEVFDNKKTEYQNMIDNGFLKVFDCGNLVFIKKYGSD